MNSPNILRIPKTGTSYSTGKILLYVVLAGLLVRICIAYALSLDPHGLRMPDDYIAFGQRLIDLHFDYDDPVRCPLTIAVSAAAILAFGSFAVYAVVAFQLLLSAAMIALVYFIASSFSGRRVALLAAGIAAADPTLIAFSATVSSEAIFVPAACAALSLFIVAMRNPDKVIMAVALGLSLAVCQYTRPTGFLILVSFWCVSLLLVTNSARTMIIATVAMVACCAPWVIRNGIKYDAYQFTSSYDYNTAALLVGIAKTRMEPELAAAVGAGGNLNIWESEIRDCPTANGYAYAKCAKQVALGWAASHKLAVAYYYVRGLALRWLSPPAQRYDLAFNGQERFLPSFTIPLSLWRALFGIFAAIGLWGSFARQAPVEARLAPITLGLLFAADYAFIGPVTDARLFALDAMLLCPLAAAGIAYAFAKVRNAQKRGASGYFGGAVP